MYHRILLLFFVVSFGHSAVFSQFDFTPKPVPPPPISTNSSSGVAVPGMAAALADSTANPATAQDGNTDNTGGSTFGNSTTQLWNYGAKLTARSDCSNVVILVPMPQEWPEQQVKVVNQAVDSTARATVRKLDGAAMLVLSIPRLPGGNVSESTVTLEITRRELLPPKSTQRYVVPKKNVTTIRPYLGPSPLIESDKKVFADLYKQITTGITNDWDKVEAIYRYTQETIQYNGATKSQQGKGAIAAMRDGDGDCKDLCAFFIAICRAGRIPARTVVIPEHCYAEFYLEDADGKGYWFPCEPSGTYAFGWVPHTKPILQKGDNYRIPELKNERMVILQTTMIGEADGQPPIPTFIGRQVQ